MKRLALTSDHIPAFVFEQWQVVSVTYRDWQIPAVLFVFGG